MKFLNAFIKKESPQAIFKKQIKTAENLSSLLDIYVIPFDLERCVRTKYFLSFNISRDRIEVDNFSKHQETVDFLLKKLPNARIKNVWHGLDEMHICFDGSKAFKKEPNLTYLVNTGCRFDEIVKYYKEPHPESFNSLLAKYEDTFINLISTIDELITANEEISSESKLLICEILLVFIEEFNSLKKYQEEKLKLDKDSFEQSLTTRLQDELTLVKKIKTDWNSSLIELRDENV